MCLLLWAILWALGCSPILWLPSLNDGRRSWQEDCDEALWSMTLTDTDANFGQVQNILFCFLARQFITNKYG